MTGSIDDMRFWCDTLADPPGRLRLPGGRLGAPAAPTAAGGLASVAFRIPAPVWRRIAALARIDAFTVVQAGIAMLMARLGAGADVWIGTECEAGARRNGLVLRTDASGNPDLTTMLDRADRANRSAFAHAGVAFGEVRAALRETGADLPDSVIQIGFTRLGTDPSGGLPGIGRPELHFVLGPGGPRGLTMRLHHDTARVDRRTARDIAAWLVRLLELASAAPTTPIAALDLLSPEAREQVLARGQGRRLERVASNLPDRVAQRADRNPAAVALMSEAATVTYRQLDRRANRLARLLAAPPRRQ